MIRYYVFSENIFSSCGLCNAGSLPDGMTADGLYNSRMEELAESVVELSRSTPVPFGWGSECDMYTLDNQEPASECNGSQETPTGAAGATSAAGAGSASGREQAHVRG